MVLCKDNVVWCSVKDANTAEIPEKRIVAYRSSFCEHEFSRVENENVLLGENIKVSSSRVPRCYFFNKDNTASGISNSNSNFIESLPPTKALLQRRKREN
jgi:hypothetical protein